MALLNPIKERSPTLVIADFGTNEAAAAALAALHDQQAFIVGPKDPMAPRKLEPDSRGIGRTLLMSHLLLGAAGALVGLLAGWLLIRNWPAAALSPGYTLFVATALGAVFGMLLAGLISIRPDHVVLIRQAHAARKRGRWIVAVHPTDMARADDAMAVLRRQGAAPKRSL